MQKTENVGFSGSFPRFCELYEAWESRLSPTMRQVHPAGERLFVDYAGQTVELVDGRTGEVRTAQVFVAVLGASSYTYAEASWTQTPQCCAEPAYATLHSVPDAEFCPDAPDIDCLATVRIGRATCDYEGPGNM